MVRADDVDLDSNGSGSSSYIVVLSLAMRSLLPAAPALSASALMAACEINQRRRLMLRHGRARLGLGRVVGRRLAAAHRVLRRSHETFHG